MKISIITVCRNASETLERTIRSVSDQGYDNVEHIIIDGDSNDGTQSTLESLSTDKSRKWWSEPDHGIYDAMNKGIHRSSGDIIGILNADDVFFDSTTLNQVANHFDSHPKLNLVYGNIVFQKGEKIWRSYSAQNWTPKKLAWGYMPPHPSIFIRRELFNELGFYKTNYKIAADYELLIRFFLADHIHADYLPITTTRMSLGGASTKNLNSTLILNREIRRGCHENGLDTNYFMIYSKYLFKWKELINA